MERLVDYRYSELISAGMDILPPGMANRLRGTHFLTGTDPFYAGLKAGDDKIEDGRSYRTTWFCSYPWNQALSGPQRQTTIVLQEYESSGYPLKLHPLMIVHELGHVLDEILGFNHIAEPVTEFAKRNHCEAFAEAFTSWLNPGYGEYYRQLRQVDEKILSLFRGLEELWGRHERYSS